ncbi:class I SAM-dependent methyltransferase [Lysobacter tyrosinilyticus]
MDHADETAEFWLPYPHDDLALRVAILHSQRRELQEAKAEGEIQSVRRAIGAAFIAGHGIEVGAGARPFPIPEGAKCFYGDVRDEGELATYFGNDNVSFMGKLDAQTLDGVPLASLDFAISAHVIEHLFDPLGSIRATIERLKPNGVFLLVVPELTQTWDRRRPPTTVDHMIADLRDGGESTRLQAYLEHFQFVAPELGVEIPEEEIDRRARETMATGHDIHVHAWRAEDFRAMLDYAAPRFGFEVVVQIPSGNENLYVLRRQQKPGLVRRIGRHVRSRFFA